MNSMKMFGFGNKLKNKLTATRFEFSFVIHNLQPWPANNRAIAIGYQRGKRRRGATRSVYPSTAPGRLGNVVRFNEKFEIPVSLYKASGGGGGSALGPFKKKCLILAVLETDGRTQATAALGRVVVNLAEFASVEHQETRTFLVSCNKSVHSAVGEPQLMVTIRCRWKGAAKLGGANGRALPDDMGSVSTDTTGSRMTQNLSSFLRFKFKGGGGVPQNEEQDLRGFEKKNDLNAANSYMDTIEESHDEPPEQNRRKSLQLAADQNRRSSLAAEANRRQSMQLSPDSHRRAAAMNNQTSPPSSAGGFLGLRHSGSSPGLAERDSDPMSRTTPVNIATSGLFASTSLSGRSSGGNNASPSLPPATEQAVQGGLRGAYASYNRPAQREDVVDSVMSTPMSSFGGKALEHSEQNSMRNRGIMTPAGSETWVDNEVLKALRAELLTVASSEAAIYLAQPVAAAQGKDTTRSAHAPARRLARTMVCLGSHDGATFGSTALRLLKAQVATAGDGLSVLAFWWSNTVHLRAMLQGLSLAAATGMMVQSNGMGHWASAAFVPELQKLERVIFDEILSRLWDRVLLPAVTGSGAKAAPAKAAAPTKRATQEAAIKKWFEGLEAVSVALARIGNGGHSTLLRQQVLLQCLKKLDALMFFYLLGGDQQPNIMSDYDPNNSLWGGPGRAVPHLDESQLPFAKGVLTFGGGMGVKMTVTRLQQWASSEAALADMSAQSPQNYQAPAPLFPLLRAAADLLMMPKELLLDRAIRLDVCSALSMKSVIHILQQFQPDEFSLDGINPAILESLTEESATPLTMRSHAAEVSAGYRPPSDSSVMAAVEAGQEPGLEYDADSEDELEEMGRTVVSERGAGVGGPVRFRLLHELWTSGVPRRRAVTLQSQLSHSSLAQSLQHQHSQSSLGH